MKSARMPREALRDKEEEDACKLEASRAGETRGASGVGAGMNTN